MNLVINGFKTGLVLSFFWVSAVIAQAETGKLLDELDLEDSQREEINAVLIGGMQSLGAINEELFKLENSPAATENRSEHEQMRMALTEQRFRLVQSMASDILNVLNDAQLSKFEFGHLIEALPKNSDDPATWKWEL